LSDGFPIQNRLKQQDILPPLLFTFTLEYAIWKVQDVELHGTHQLLVYVYDVTLLGKNIKTHKERHRSSVMH
jgi:hypothetical protein